MPSPKKQMLVSLSDKPDDKFLSGVDLTRCYKSSVCHSCANQAGISNLKCKHLLQQENIPLPSLELSTLSSAWPPLFNIDNGSSPAKKQWSLPIIGEKKGMSTPAPKAGPNSSRGIVSPNRPPLQSMNSSLMVTSSRGRSGSFNVSTATIPLNGK